MFKDAKVGDRVVDYRRGEGEIADVGESMFYPVGVQFDSTLERYTYEGRLTEDDLHPSLFPEGTEIPRPVVDTSIRPKVEDVWELKGNKYFITQFCDDDNIYGVNGKGEKFTINDEHSYSNFQNITHDNTDGWTRLYPPED